MSTGWEQIDGALGGGLVPGVVHEWFAGTGARTGAGEIPPLLILTHLARRALQYEDVSCSQRVFWIGKHVWPRLAPEEGADLLERSVFVDPPDDATRLWAIDLCLRSPSVAVVVADGRGLSMAASRRLQLAAEAGRTMVLLTRPAAERRTLSAAATRWHVHRMLVPKGSDESRPRWMLELLRCKGRARAASSLRDTGDGGASAASSESSKQARALSLLPESVRAWADFYVPNAETQRWLVEWNSAAGVVSELPELVDRRVAASPEAPVASAASRSRSRASAASA